VPVSYTFTRRNIHKEVFAASDVKDIVFQITTTAPWNKLYHRQFILDNQLHFQEENTISNDAYFTLMAMALATRVTLLDEVLLYYRVNTRNQLTAKRNIHHILDQISSRKKTFHHLKKLGLYK